VCKFVPGGYSSSAYAYVESCKWVNGYADTTTSWHIFVDTVYSTKYQDINLVD
jgi:hypothetical protein